MSMTELRYISLRRKTVIVSNVLVDVDAGRENELPNGRTRRKEIVS
jgi:hypothetical protein